MIAFLTGACSAALVAVGALVAALSGTAAGSGDWTYFSLLLVWSAVLGIGGALVFISAMEVRK